MGEKQLAMATALITLATACVNLAAAIAGKGKAPKRKRGKHKR